MSRGGIGIFYLPDGASRARSAARDACRSSIPLQRMRRAEHAPRDPFSVLERRHGLAEIVERRSVVLEERLRVNFNLILSVRS